MKLLQIALSLFNIFAISVALVPKNVEIVMKQYVDPSTGDFQGMYEKRSNYLKEGEKFSDPQTGEPLFDLKSMTDIQTELTVAADKIVTAYNADQPHTVPDTELAGKPELQADEFAQFTVTYNGLTVEALSKLLKIQPNPKLIWGTVEINPYTELESRAAAAAAEPPQVTR